MFCFSKSLFGALRAHYHKTHTPLFGCAVVGPARLGVAGEEESRWRGRKRPHPLLEAGTTQLDVVWLTRRCLELTLDGDGDIDDRSSRRGE
jgi:hypothetical protein